MRMSVADSWNTLRISHEVQQSLTFSFPGPCIVAPLTQLPSIGVGELVVHLWLVVSGESQLMGFQDSHKASWNIFNSCQSSFASDRVTSYELVSAHLIS